MLPAWLGSDDAFEEFLTQNPDGMERLREMSKLWPFFRMYMDMLEMVIAKTDADVVAYYEERLLESDSSIKAIGETLRKRLARIRQLILRITDQKELLERSPGLAHTITLRNRYIEPLHGLQAELMYRNRGKTLDQIPEDIARAMMTTMTGIAAGLRNTG